MSGENDTTATVFAMVPAEVTDAGNYVQQVAESLINGLSSLDHEVSGVLNNWTGSAAGAFGEGWAETKKGAIVVLNALNTMGELLGDASKAIVSQDISSSNTLSSLDLPELNL
ncbi:WXG100 family type VII secretion target [Nocardia sp. NPDC127606]|uniref:WXG100 family type VII secretion target n=1 Tax=Nocardia sp. NPDC127606 TaxID=3345406 RepID=UPI00362656F5